MHPPCWLEMNTLRPLLIALMAAILVPAASHAAAPAVAPERFTFAVIGCVPYARYNDGGKAFPRLIEEVNRHAPVFTVHVGDTLSGSENPTDALLLQRRNDFNTFDGPLIYTPGDNEWTDSHTGAAGGHDPLERLAKIRELYFAEEHSLGKTTIPLVTQRRDPAFKKFVENARWAHGGVVFATVHVVGSNNNNQPAVPGAVAEWQERDAANEAWVRAVFAEARSTNALGVALFIQADPFAADAGQAGYKAGFERFLKATE